MTRCHYVAWFLPCAMFLAAIGPAVAQVKDCSMATGFKHVSLGSTIFGEKVASYAESKSLIQSSTARVDRQLTCSLKEMRASIVQYVRSGAPGGGQTQAKYLQEQLSFAVSQILNKNRQKMEQLVEVALSNNDDPEDLQEQMRLYATRNIAENRGMMNFFIQASQAKGADNESLKVALSGIIAGKDSPAERNRWVASLISLAFGAEPTLAKEIKQLFTQLLVEDMSGKINSLARLMAVAEQNDADISVFKRVLLQFLAAEVGADSNALMDIVEILVGSQWGQSEDLDALVTSIIITDITTNEKSVVYAMIQLTANNPLRANNVEAAIEGIVHNVVNGSRGRTIPNAFALGFGRDATLIARLRALDVAATIDALVVTNAQFNNGININEVKITKPNSALGLQGISKTDTNGQFDFGQNSATWTDQGFDVSGIDPPTDFQRPEARPGNDLAVGTTANQPDSTDRAAGSSAAATTSVRSDTDSIGSTIPRPNIIRG
eukprot:CAMPEP_0117678520 /NCGR_PEP_ID=MMETSP0804-20121206/17342_1 /TAXON_ID=1074897 /ORGANISM="Tetraselmis astigmatica, Strain CCMP880" /LENGTH=492 /DNA_ID=CAMNT_0005487915 /DNA_START=54 /DNA_END=1532 /DNA_ORIENTATION=+